MQSKQGKLGRKNLWRSGESVRKELGTVWVCHLRKPQIWNFGKIWVVDVENLRKRFSSIEKGSK
jgi:hypothetical protein